METVRIRDIKVFITAPAKVNLVVVRVETSVPGLYGLGCATFAWRAKAVAAAVDEYLRPLLIGRDVDDIEDIWNAAYQSSYWRGGPVLNNALSGVDEALWDIKGKRAGLPLYSLLGGRSRTGVAIYRHANASTTDEVLEKIAKLKDEGYRYARVCSGSGRLDCRSYDISSPRDPFDGMYFSPRQYMDKMIGLFSRIRDEFGDEIELIHDVHERLSLPDTISFARAMEEFNLYFLEDSLGHEEISSYRRLREKTTIPLAVGELFTSPCNWMELIEDNLVDYLRVHASAIGGITPALKLCHIAEAHGIGIAFHGPDDISPVGMAAQLHIDMNIHNFGVQEFMGFSDEVMDVFPCGIEIEDGYAYPSNEPGLGVDFDEVKARRYPAVEMDASWTIARNPDGTIIRP